MLGSETDKGQYSSEELGYISLPGHTKDDLGSPVIQSMANLNQDEQPNCSRPPAVCTIG